MLRFSLFLLATRYQVSTYYYDHPVATLLDRKTRKAWEKGGHILVLQDEWTGGRMVGCWGQLPDNGKYSKVTMLGSEVDHYIVLLIVILPTRYVGWYWLQSRAGALARHMKIAIFY